MDFISLEDEGFSPGFQSCHSAFLFNQNRISGEVTVRSFIVKRVNYIFSTVTSKKLTIFWGPYFRN